MPLRLAKPLIWKPRGASDAVDGTNSFPGAMTLLQNLIPDPSTTDVYVPRPAAVKLQDFTGFASPGQVSCMFILGDIVYGLIGSGLNPGYDQPFAYDLATETELVVSGISSLNVPVSQPTSGDWTPPIMATLSTFILVTHPGFTGFANGYFGWFDITSPEAPVWNSGNTTGNPLILPPTSVSIYGGRAYYAVQNATPFSDAQAPLSITNANQVLTYGSETPILAMAGLPLNNLLGGVVQSLMVFKDDEGEAIFQVTGDYATSTLAINRLNVTAGTQAPNTLCTTPYGLAFVDYDGLRLIDFSGNVSDPIGNNGQGITLPFKYAIFPSRMVAAFNRNIIRITVQNGLDVTRPFQEWWYDFNLKRWTGPHTFPVAQIKAWRGTFIAANPLIAPIIPPGPPAPPPPPPPPAPSLFPINDGFGPSGLEGFFFNGLLP